MDDLAPAAVERTSEEVRRTPERNFVAPKKVAKKALGVPVQKPQPGLDPVPEPDHQIDVLA